MKFITLLTDFGQHDGYTGIMKGVIYTIAPDAQIIDISHAVRPQSILDGALVWNRSYVYFPEHTVHVAVVDPGVGTPRRPIAARIGKYTFVCPDNGLITPILERGEETGEPVAAVHLNQPRFWLPQVSNVFHGRDIFAPVAAHLANGVPLEDLGSPITDLVRMQIPEPQALANGWRGQVITIDHFGSLGTNLTAKHIPDPQKVIVRAAGLEIRGLVRAFGDRAPGELVALIDSDSSLAIAVVNGSAAQKTGLGVGDAVEVALP